VVLPRALREKLTESAAFNYGLGLLNREGVRAVWIDPSRHPTSGSHQILLRFITRDDIPDVSGPPREVVLNKSVDTRSVSNDLA
jgi:hypothetical protein